MTNDEIIRMAREAGLDDWTVHGRIEDKWVCLEKFYALAVAAERKACAKLASENEELRKANAAFNARPIVLDMDRLSDIEQKTIQEYCRFSDVPFMVLPQRKPLTDDEIEYWIGCNSTKKALCRAIERAHGIGDA